MNNAVDFIHKVKVSNFVIQIYRTKLLMKPHPDLLEQFKKFLPEIVRESFLIIYRRENKAWNSSKARCSCKKERRRLKY